MGRHVQAISAALLLLLSPAFAVAAAKKLHGLRFINLSTVYYSFEHIDPILLNTGDTPVYLSSLHPQAAARLVRYNGGTKEWEYGRWARACASVADVMKPIEVTPGGSLGPRVFWQYSMDDWDKPTAFETADDEKRPLKGRYKLSLQYAEQPWVLGNLPKQKFTVDSEEFFVDP